MCLERVGSAAVKARGGWRGREEGRGRETEGERGGWRGRESGREREKGGERVREGGSLRERGRADRPSVGRADRRTDSDGRRWRTD